MNASTAAKAANPAIVAVEDEDSDSRVLPGLVGPAAKTAHKPVVATHCVQLDATPEAQHTPFDAHQLLAQDAFAAQVLPAGRRLGAREVDAVCEAVRDGAACEATGGDDVVCVAVSDGAAWEAAGGDAVCEAVGTAEFETVGVAEKVTPGLPLELSVVVWEAVGLCVAQTPVPSMRRTMLLPESVYKGKAGRGVGVDTHDRRPETMLLLRRWQTTLLHSRRRQKGC